MLSACSDIPLDAMDLVSGSSQRGAAFDLNMSKDDRGYFTELIKTLDHGQISVNVNKPGKNEGTALA